MSIEGAEKRNEQPPISVDRLKEMLEKYPKLLSAALLVGMLSIDGARNTAEAQNEVTGGVTQSESTDAGVTLGNAEEAPVHEVDKGTIVTVREEQATLPVKEKSHETPPEDDENPNVSVGKIIIDGKDVTDEY